MHRDYNLRYSSITQWILGSAISTFPLLSIIKILWPFTHGASIFEMGGGGRVFSFDDFISGKWERRDLDGGAESTQASICLLGIQPMVYSMGD